MGDEVREEIRPASPPTAEADATPALPVHLEALPPEERPQSPAKAVHEEDRHPNQAAAVAVHEVDQADAEKVRALAQAHDAAMASLRAELGAASATHAKREHTLADMGDLKTEGGKPDGAKQELLRRRRELRASLKALEEAAARAAAKRRPAPGAASVSSPGGGEAKPTEPATKESVEKLKSELAAQQRESAMLQKRVGSREDSASLLQHTDSVIIP
ncbi:hypothetical protein T492DRAFT_858106 [Pavlovales sp. CCMP2436]|nr:hypothetical protein T492DRAFT_858106 [Pavlovales sp. CCMP2436]